MIFQLEHGEEYIRLGDLLKAAGLVDSGGEAKTEIQEGRVEVDGAVRKERGAKIRAGQIVKFRDQTVEVRNS